MLLKTDLRNLDSLTDSNDLAKVPFVCCKREDKLLGTCFEIVASGLQSRVSIGWQPLVGTFCTSLESSDPGMDERRTADAPVTSKFASLRNPSTSTVEGQNCYTYPRVYEESHSLSVGIHITHMEPVAMAHQPS